MVNQQFATAVHILLALAYDKNKIPNSEVLVASVKTNPVVIRRLLSLLAKAGLVTTTRGKAGGVRLSKEPHTINLKHVFIALESKHIIQSRTKPPFEICPVSRSMSVIMDGICSETHKSGLNCLESQKLSDLTKKINKSAHA